MNITFNYFAQIRKMAATESETVRVPDGATVAEALRTLDHGDEFKDILFDGSGNLRTVILLIVSDMPAAPDQVLNDGDRVQVFSPVAGG